MQLLTRIALPAAAMAALGAPAAATSFDITLSGTIATGADDLGLFGPAHTSLGGDAFSIHYSLDPGTMTTTTDSDGVSPLYRFDTPGRLRIEVTINGKTFRYQGTAQSVYEKTDHAAEGGNPAFSRLDFHTYDGINSLAESVTVIDAPLGPLANLPSGDLAHSSLDLSLFSGAVRASSVDAGTISTGAVPELASWTMMLAGFGAVGAAMRRRRTRLAFAH